MFRSTFYESIKTYRPVLVAVCTNNPSRLTFYFIRPMSALEISRLRLPKPPEEESKGLWNGIKPATSRFFAPFVSAVPLRSAGEKSLNWSLKFYAKAQSIPPRLYFITLGEAEFIPVARSKASRGTSRAGIVRRKLKSLFSDTAKDLYSDATTPGFLVSRAHVIFRSPFVREINPRSQSLLRAHECPLRANFCLPFSIRLSFARRGILCGG